MPRLIEYVSVGFCSSYGDGDWRISCAIEELTQERFNELRSTMCAAIGQMEDMRRRAIERKQAPKQQAKKDQP